MKRLLFFLLFFTTENILASEFTFLSFNHSNSEEKVAYSLERENCEIKNNSLKIQVSAESSDDFRDLKLLEGIYYSATVIKYSKKALSFYIDAVTNLELEVKLKNNNNICEKSIIAKWRGKKFEISRIEVIYHHRFGFPTLNEIVLHTANNKELVRIPSYEAKSYLPFYEFKVGLAFNLQTNIRPNDTKTFHKNDTIIEPLPAFLLRYGPFFLNKDGAGVALIPLKNFLLLATFLIEGEPYEGEGLQERETSIFFGPLLKVGPIRFQYYFDLNKTTDGKVFKMTLAPELEVTEKWILTPQIFYQYWDKKYVDYYFGVNSSEATILGSSSYIGKATSNVGFAIQSDYKWKRWTIITSFDVKSYGQNVFNSPIAVHKNQYRLITAFLYDLF